MDNFTNIKSELDIQSRHPHIKTNVNVNDRPHFNNHIEHELFYQVNGRYPDTRMDNKIPEEIRERALDIEDKLFK